MKPLHCKLIGLGAWGPGFENWQQLSKLLSGDTSNPAIGQRTPKPDIIPANERRRSPLAVRMAVETSWQACQAANIDPKQLNCVFVSSLGDTQLSDYICSTLASEHKQLSPTKFHNSVHNAAAGYWSISTGCMKSTNSLAGFNESVSLTLLEAMSQCVVEHCSTLITFYDVPSSKILGDIYPNDEAFSASLIITPNDKKEDGLNLNAEVIETVSSWPNMQFPAPLQACYEHSPTARILAILDAAHKNNTKKTHGSVLEMPLSSGTSLKLSIE
ncbi:MAG: beta-ketoacyl synthase chain length factor [Gammaproteobacteria bacterium]|nr:beta-ketoacyl synthase chain length factor [Gammaproteobacteria bacterium]